MALMSEVRGHDDVKAQLLHLTRQKKFFNGVIFAGPDGVGKKKVALACLQELNCEKPEACGRCASCLKVASTAEVYLHRIEPDGERIKIEQIREAIHFLSLKSWVPHRFVIIDHVEKIMPQAANALLKSLEEPPEGVHFILMTSNLSQILPTIRSRCQVVQFQPLSETVLRQFCPDIQDWQLRWSFGRLALARKIMEDEWIDIRKAAINFLHSPQHPQVFSDLASLLSDGEKTEFVIHSWMTYLRDAYLFSQSGGQPPPLYNADITGFVEKFSVKNDIIDLLDAVFQFRVDYLGHVDKNLLLDNFSIRLGA